MELLQNLSLVQWGMIAAALAVIWFINRKEIASLWPRAPVTTTKPDSTHPRLVVLSKLDEAYDYFEAEQCPEGMAAIKAALAHVYHDHPPRAVA